MLCLYVVLLIQVLANAQKIAFVIFSEPPTYFYVNIALAALRNNVIVISDRPQALELGNLSSSKVEIVDMQQYLATARQFENVYRHLSRDNSKSRILYELHCFQRWFILRDFMKSKNINRLYYSDNDNAIFVDASEVARLHLGQGCDTVVNVERQYHAYHWVVAGEFSLWSLNAIESFCEFTINVYRDYSATLALKRAGGSTVVDMSLLWLWFVSNNKNTEVGWHSTRPFYGGCDNSSISIVQKRQRSDDAFVSSKLLQLPPIKQPIVICNGMNVKNRTVFDHMHGWQSGASFSLDLEGQGQPYVTNSIALINGGVPESLELVDIAKLSKQRLYFNNIHYQGDAKSLLIYDICRVLYLPQNIIKINSAVTNICKAELLKKNPNLSVDTPVRSMNCLLRKDCKSTYTICA